MSVILTIASLVFGGYLHEPMWFDSGPYVHTSSHESLVECLTAKAGHEVHMQEAICAKGELYVKDKNVAQKATGDLNYVECDYWAGCYIQE